MVWQARQLSLDRLVAVKVYQRGLDEGDRRRFLREAAAAGRLSNHPGIVTAHDAGMLPDDRPYLMMELCPGGSLTRWLKPDNRPSEERVRQVGVRDRRCVGRRPRVRCAAPRRQTSQHLDRQLRQSPTGRLRGGRRGRSRGSRS